MKADEPKRYVIQKHVMATSVKEALEKEAETPVQSVFPDSNQEQKPTASAIGFKTVSARFPYECSSRIPKEQ